MANHLSMTTHGPSSNLWLRYICIILPLLRCCSAGYSTTSPTNFVVYWGQDSSGNTGGPGQKRLLDYCAGSDFDVINLAFLEHIATPSLNFFGIADYCSTAGASTSATSSSERATSSCGDIASDILRCQQTYDKAILLSIGGASFSEGGFASSDAAIQAAQNLWATFGPPPSAPSSSSSSSSSSANTSTTTSRPFGNVTLNGFDLDIESPTQNMVPFANELRRLMDTSSPLRRRRKTSRPYPTLAATKFYLTATPQCPYPDIWNNDMLNGAVAFDFVAVQFYNNACGLQSFSSSTTSSTSITSSASNTRSDTGAFNFSQWNTWAQSISLNPRVKILLGVPGNTLAAGSGYIDATALAEVIAYCKTFPSFGGVMAWDASQVDANDGFAGGVRGSLGR